MIDNKVLSPLCFCLPVFKISIKLLTSLAERASKRERERGREGGIFTPQGSKSHSDAYEGIIDL